MLPRRWRPTLTSESLGLGVRPLILPMSSKCPVGQTNWQAPQVRQTSENSPKGVVTWRLPPRPMRPMAPTCCSSGAGPGCVGGVPLGPLHHAGAAAAVGLDPFIIAEGGDVDPHLPGGFQDSG